MNKYIRLLLIGKNSYISTNLFTFLRRKIIVKKISFEEFKKIKIKSLKSFTHICNCSITKKYSSNKYQKENDLDLKIINKIKPLKIKFIFLSTRKVYKPTANIKELSKKKPLGNYAKNKLITESKIKKLIPSHHIILRISNIIGFKKKNSKYRKISTTFIDNFYNFKKSKKVIFYEDHYKDFLTINQFKQIFLKILNAKLNGTYNFSLGKKIYISELLNALSKNKINKKFIKTKIIKKDSFYLNNDKLFNIINFKVYKKDLLKYCYKM